MMTFKSPNREEYSKGKVLGGKYRVVELIGEGGLGRVYKAIDLSSGQPVAIKTFKEELLNSETQRYRFLLEAKILKQIEHKNIVSFLDFFIEDNLFFLVIEYLEGNSLATILKYNHNLNYTMAIPIFQEILEGLAYLHNLGIIHRDIKPSNLFITLDGRVKIIDFGISFYPRRQGERRLTYTGIPLGTVEYMAPEQIRGEKCSFSCDIYSLGVTLFETLTGCLPFSGDIYEIQKGHVEKEPPHISDFIPEIPPSIDNAVVRSLSKHPKDRFNSALEFLYSLGTHFQKPVVYLCPNCSIMKFSEAGQKVSTDEVCHNCKKNMCQENTLTLRISREKLLESFQTPSRDGEKEEKTESLENDSPSSSKNESNSIKIFSDLNWDWISNEKDDEQIEDQFAFENADTLGMKSSDIEKVREKVTLSIEEKDSGCSGGDGLSGEIMSKTEKIAVSIAELFSPFEEDKSEEDDCSELSDQVFIPSGLCIVGSNSDKGALPEAFVELDSFYIDIYPVTNLRYLKFILETGHSPPPHWWNPEENGGKFFFDEEGKFPVTNVTYYDALTFCEWAEMRLPTEEEWEKAARYSDGRPYPWGWEWEEGRANFFSGMTTPVDLFENGKSYYGVFDLLGNVWEWVEARKIPFYTSSHLSTYRVLKGGSCAEIPGTVRAYSRWIVKGFYRALNIGFRCCKDK